ncbi:MAG: hypothetical protein ACLTXW_15900 [Christensenellales bacterium]
MASADCGREHGADGQLPRRRASLLHTPCTILRRYREDDPESRNSRVDQLLRTLQVADPTHPDFAVVDAQLAIQRKRGLDFLQSAISQAVSQATPAKAR